MGTLGLAIKLSSKEHHMNPVVNEIFSLFGLLIRFLGFLIIGFALARFVLDNYRMSEWQVRIALALGFFGLLVGLTAYASPGSSGAFALGAGAALVYALIPRKAASEEQSKSVG
jgi:peptidoglycan/LPS O-acetylase OafA/YrhL